MKVVIEKELEDWWATPEEWATMTDEEAVELLREDLLAVIDGASWTLIRSVESTQSVQAEVG